MVTVRKWLSLLIILASRSLPRKLEIIAFNFVPVAAGQRTFHDREVSLWNSLPKRLTELTNVASKRILCVIYKEHPRSLVVNILQIFFKIFLYTYDFNHFLLFLVSHILLNNVRIYNYFEKSHNYLESKKVI